MPIGLCTLHTEQIHYNSSRLTWSQAALYFTDRNLYDMFATWLQCAVHSMLPPPPQKKNTKKNNTNVYNMYINLLVNNYYQIRLLHYMSRCDYQKHMYPGEWQFQLISIKSIFSNIVVLKVGLVYSRRVPMQSSQHYDDHTHHIESPHQCKSI